MSTRHPFVKDYSLREEVDSKGSIRVKPEYTGKFYRFAAEQEPGAGLRRRLLVLVMLSWILYLTAFSVVSSAAKTRSVALPFAFIVLSSAFLTQTVIPLQRAKAPMKHDKASAFNHKYPPAALAMMILSLVSLIGDGIAFLRGAVFLRGDAVFLVCDIALSGIGWYLFSVRSRIRTVACE